MLPAQLGIFGIPKSLFNFHNRGNAPYLNFSNSTYFSLPPAVNTCVRVRAHAGESMVAYVLVVPRTGKSGFPFFAVHHGESELHISAERDTA